MTSCRLMDGGGGRPGNGPSSATSYSGAYLAGTAFQVSQANMWLQGYWWWVCDTGQQTGAQKFALWQPVSAGTAILIPGSVVTSGTLTAGQWNYVPLATPIPLSISGASASQGSAPYIAATGYSSTTGFPLTANQFGSGDPYTNGITNGPLLAYSDGTAGSASNPVPVTSVAQGLFSTGSADPSAACPFTGFESGNFWMDVQVSDTPPAGYSGSYRLWPNAPSPVSLTLDTANNFTLGTEFTLSQACTLDNIWFLSPAGASQLPTDCGIWLVSGQTLVPGTHNSSPSWSGAAGSGWVSCAYSGVTLPAGDYKVSVFNGAASPSAWNDSSFPYWASGAAGANGITVGPLSAPNDASATSPGQSTYHQGASFAWPDTYASGIGSATYWVDAEVTPLVTSPPLPPLMPPGALSPAAWQFPRYPRLGQTVTIAGSGGVVPPKPALSGSGLVVPPPAAPAAPLLMPPGRLSPAAWQAPRYRRLGQAVTIAGSGGVVLLKPALAGAATPPATTAVQPGSWWGLVSVLKQSRSEFEAYVSRPPMACPNDGEPLRYAPATASGSGVERYCPYCGWQYPRDHTTPSRP